MYVGEVHNDESSKSHFSQVSVLVKNPDGEIRGALTASVDLEKGFDSWCDTEAKLSSVVNSQ